MTSQPSQEGDIAVDSTFIGEGITSTDYDSTITLDGWGDGCKAGDYLVYDQNTFACKPADKVMPDPVVITSEGAFPYEEMEFETVKTESIGFVHETFNLYEAYPTHSCPVA